MARDLCPVWRMIWRSVAPVGRGLGNEAVAQGVAILLRVSPPGPPHQPLHNGADRVLVQGLAHAAVLPTRRRRCPSWMAPWQSSSRDGSNDSQPDRLGSLGLYVCY
jgi:hypothetical protein